MEYLTWAVPLHWVPSFPRAENIGSAVAVLYTGQGASVIFSLGAQSWLEGSSYIIYVVAKLPYKIYNNILRLQPPTDDPLPLHSRFNFAHHFNSIFFRISCLYMTIACLICRLFPLVSQSCILLFFKKKIVWKYIKIIFYYYFLFKTKQNINMKRTGVSFPLENLHV
jgi:hypothetical protein